jgi:hypothetical protein
MDPYEATVQAAAVKLREALEPPNLNREQVIDALSVSALAGDDPNWDMFDDRQLRAIAERLVAKHAP